MEYTSGDIVLAYSGNIKLAYGKLISFIKPGMSIQIFKPIKNVVSIIISWSVCIYENENDIPVFVIVYYQSQFLNFINSKSNFASILGMLENSYSDMKIEWQK